MKLSILDKKRKALNRAINLSVLSFTVLWLIIFTLSLFNNEITNWVMTFLILISGLPLSTGLLSLTGLAIFRKKHIEINTNGEICLTLNISEEDYKLNKLHKMEYSGNYITVHELGAECEISSKEAKRLLSQVEQDKWQIRFDKKKTKLLTQSPKEVFDSAMSMLWAAS